MASAGAAPVGGAATHGSAEGVDPALVLLPVVLAGTVSAAAEARAHVDARVDTATEPRQVGRVDADGLGPRERQLAEDVAATWEVDVDDAPDRGFPGIDGLVDGEPAMFRSYGRTGGLRALVARAEDGARKAGHSGVDLYVDARELPARELDTVPRHGVLRRILVRTADGWFLMPGATP